MSVRALAWSPDSQLLLSASDDKRLVLHDVRTSAGGKPGSGAVASLNGHGSWVLSASIATDGRAAISGSSDRSIKIWDLSQRSCVSTLQEQDEVWGVCWKPTSGFGAGSFASSGEGCVRFWRSAGTA
ncbi:hypothetical protein M407DRAFT_99859 [Tulasnella calospora MUT 4182]|uniref:Uncharacterized protein n=1 Tax=Tulasnella calospora MUT 4182 TaxID=1051891 RepID=A0A0C3KSN4_9AGAM|nr:hypothetical protein M407DRAFT_99859 [Tulasnella calospora MUT 4182]